MKILVVDDSGYARKRLAQILVGAGHEVIEAESGTRALDLFNEAAPDAVTVDLLMPEMDGLELVHRLRLLRSDVPVVVVSADIQESTKKEVMAAGAAAFVSKLSPVEEVLQTVETARPVEVSVEFDPGRMDTFRELMNLAMGRAAQALEHLLEKRVALTVPDLRIMPMSQMADFLQDEAPKIGTATEQAFSGQVYGGSYLIFPRQQAATLIRELVAADRELETLSAADKSILAELTNIVLNAVLSDLGNLLGARLRLGLPAVYFNLSAADMVRLMAQESPAKCQATVLVSRLDIGRLSFLCYLTLVMNARNVEILMQSMQDKLR